jgi:uncharacterized RDD family membrane protein YckC
MTSVSEQVNVQVTGRRVVATLLDGLVLGLAYGVVAWAFGTVTTVGPYSWTAETSTVPTLLYALGAFAYYLVAFVVVLVSPRRQRIGDLAAQTCVVRA